jgi:hypothetical protein
MSPGRPIKQDRLVGGPEDDRRLKGAALSKKDCSATGWQIGISGDDLLP